MLRLLRLALQLGLFFALVAVAISIGTQETGPWEKGALLLLAAALVWVASRVRGIGARPV
jgi:peptidoglycan/LPS O-acetylase OafA/YrhL